MCKRAMLQNVLWARLDISPMLKAEWKIFPRGRLQAESETMTKICAGRAEQSLGFLGVRKKERD